jgi:hypothetical protein
MNKSEIGSKTAKGDFANEKDILKRLEGKIQEIKDNRKYKTESQGSLFDIL